jgi:hypothetical protein
VMIVAAAGVRVEAIYHREHGRLKIVLVGSMEQNAAYFKMIAAILEADK